MSKPNRLADQTSPYLLQHAHNPVDWYPWGQEALDRAKRENKLILVSIGYSACHWCHVMERESFEDEATAAIMNERFICIKVDREERPDIDQVYMHAVQLISGQGGWPLNCFTLPDGRPVYGGTYFRTGQWQGVLRNLSDMYVNDPDKVVRYAEQLTKGLRQSEWVEGSKIPASFTLADLGAVFQPWQGHFDRAEGGMNRAPKFPLPNNWQFILRYWHATGDDTALQQVRLTLDKMAYGGIYDHLGGGFARYSTDGQWKAPHFEKMLYDNAQLLELYSEAYQATGELLYKKIVVETAGFIDRELTSPEGVFYSALDADSEGVEGKFYVWTKVELESLLGNRFPLFREAYSVNSDGYWEEGQYILLKRKPDQELANAAGMKLDEWHREIDQAKNLLFTHRARRVRPGMDDKALLSWNALMAKGYVAAYVACEEPKYLETAERNLDFLLTRGRRPDGGLYRSYKGNFTINGFLEDYACLADALIALYQANFEEKWLLAAQDLVAYAIQHFRDPVSGLFYFTSDLDQPLVARKMEIMDNVMPSSNSTMAKVLFALGTLLDNAGHAEMAVRMLDQVKDDMAGYGSGYSNWAMLALNLAAPFHEVVITGPAAEEFRAGINRQYLPNKLLAGSTQASELPLFKARFLAGQTRIYVCRNRVCDLPRETVSDALDRIQKG